MNEVVKRLIKRIVPQSAINISRGGIRRILAKGRPVVIKHIPDTRIEMISDNRHDYVGGYYDITPFSDDGTKYLMLRLKSENSAEIILHDIIKKSSEVVGTTHAVNRQQGSRLRWADSEGNAFYYNDCIDGEYVCVKQSVYGEEKTIAGPAFYDMAAKKEYGLALNFSRLGMARAGYGYTTFEYKKQTKGELLEEGIDYVDLRSKASRRLFTYYDLLKISGWPIENLNRYYINHISISPDEKKFVFFWIDMCDSDSNLKTAYFVYDFESEQLSLLENINRVSHYAWRNGHEILTTVIIDKNGVKESRYMLYDVVTGAKRIIGEDRLTEDGHPSWIDSNSFVSDTYPDRMGYQTLFVYNIEANERKKLIEMYHTSRCIGEMRCDMHPRLDPLKTRVGFDGNINTVRNVYIVNLP